MEDSSPLLLPLLLVQEVEGSSSTSRVLFTIKSHMRRKHFLPFPCKCNHTVVVNSKPIYLNLLVHNIFLVNHSRLVPLGAF